MSSLSSVSNLMAIPSNGAPVYHLSENATCASSSKNFTPHEKTLIAVKKQRYYAQPDESNHKHKLNRKSAMLLANFLERLPVDVFLKIMEYNSEHRTNWNAVMSELFRHVYNPFNHYLTKEDNVITHILSHYDYVTELNKNFRCGRCHNLKETHVVLKQTKIGFWTHYGTRYSGTDVSYCSNCFEYMNEFVDFVCWDGRARRRGR
jgi:hypothetical protein